MMQSRDSSDPSSDRRPCASSGCASTIHALDSHTLCAACRNFCDFDWGCPECDSWGLVRLEEYHDFLRQFPAMVKSWQRLVPAHIRQSRQAELREIESDPSQSQAKEGGRDDNPTEIASSVDQEIQAILNPSAVDQQPLQDQRVADQQHIPDQASAFTQIANDLTSVDQQKGQNHVSIDPRTNHDQSSASRQKEPRHAPVDQQAALPKAQALSEVSRHPVQARGPGLGGAAGQVLYLPPPAPRGREPAATSLIKPLVPPKTHVRNLFSADVLVEDAHALSIPPADPRGVERGHPCKVPEPPSPLYP